jgi:hypothetical protein
VEQAYAGAAIAANWAALAHTITLFRQVAQEVGAHLGMSIPTSYISAFKPTLNR